jgi:hypothetical protein
MGEADPWDLGEEPGEPGFQLRPGGDILGHFPRRETPNQESEREQGAEVKWAQ